MEHPDRFTDRTEAGRALAQHVAQYLQHAGYGGRPLIAALPAGPTFRSAHAYGRLGGVPPRRPSGGFVSTSARGPMARIRLASCCRTLTMSAWWTWSPATNAQPASTYPVRMPELCSITSTSATLLPTSAEDQIRPTGRTKARSLCS